LIIHTHPFITFANLCSGPRKRSENWPVKTQANMTHLCTMAVRTNREMTELKMKSHGGQVLVKPPLFVYCE